MSMEDFDQTDDFDALIDKAVDTFFVEAPTDDDLEAAEMEQEAEAEAAAEESVAEEVEVEEVEEVEEKGPSLEEAVDSLFMQAFDEEVPAEDAEYVEAVEVEEEFEAESAPTAQAPDAAPPPPPDQTTSRISSGDVSTDQEIDIAVDTLFVEVPEDTPPPETEQLPAEEVAAAIEEAPPEEEPTPAAAMAEEPDMPLSPMPGAEPPPPSPSPPQSDSGGEAPYDDVMAQEIQRHMHTLFMEAPGDLEAEAPPETAPAAAASADSVAAAGPQGPLRSLQEAILTLEWEVSQSSVQALAKELRRVRAHFKDNVTVDFAAMSMRVVLDYIVKRMARAHPESIRFLLEVTDYLDKSLTSSEKDPLAAFHRILTRYEAYKSAVRRAEGLPDRKPAILNELQINDPKVFSRTVEHQAKTLIRAGYSLAKRMGRAEDPENLIRSFRFLVNRSVARILDSTQRDNVKPKPKSGSSKKKRKAAKGSGG